MLSGMLFLKWDGSGSLCFGEMLFLVDRRFVTTLGEAAKEKTLLSMTLRTSILLKYDSRSSWIFFMVLLECLPVNRTIALIELSDYFFRFSIDYGAEACCCLDSFRFFNNLYSFFFPVMLVGYEKWLVVFWSPLASWTVNLTWFILPVWLFCLTLVCLMGLAFKSVVYARTWFTGKLIRFGFGLALMRLISAVVGFYIISALLS